MKSTFFLEMSYLTRLDFRVIIFYNFKRKLCEEECLKELQSVFGNAAPSSTTVRRWYRWFKHGLTSLESPEDDARSDDSTLKMSSQSEYNFKRNSDSHMSSNMSPSSSTANISEEERLHRLKWCETLLEES